MHWHTLHNYVPNDGGGRNEKLYSLTQVNSSAYPFSPKCLRREETTTLEFYAANVVIHMEVSSPVWTWAYFRVAFQFLFFCGLSMQNCLPNNTALKLLGYVCFLASLFTFACCCSSKRHCYFYNKTTVFNILKRAVGSPRSAAPAIARKRCMFCLANKIITRPAVSQIISRV